MGILLVDTDILTYSMGHIADNNDDPKRVYKMLVRNKMNWIQKVANETFVVEQTRCFLTSNDKSNFRFQVYPEYKANRKDTKKPSMYNEIRQFIMEEYGAEMVEGMEADDKISIEAHKIHRKGSSRHQCLISSADKDLRMIPGLHHEMGNSPVYEVHNPGYLSMWRSKRTRKVFGTGLKWFYYQILVGDEDTDNIPGLDISEADAFKLLECTYVEISDTKMSEEYFDEDAWYKICLHAYHKQGKDEEELVRNARLLWLKTSEDEPLWEPPC